MSFDIYLVGVGGQGVLTIGSLIAEAAFRSDMPASFYPTKGMAQRGGFVKAQIRLGSEAAGPSIAEKRADLVIAMEVSEALKAVRFIKPEKDFVLFAHVWAPTAVMLGQADYPTLDQVLDRVREAEALVHTIEPASLPAYEGTRVPANVFVLGAALGGTGLGQVLDPEVVAGVVGTRWRRGVARNRYALQQGLAFAGRLG
jgi:indolepyruvate ferredoxin oxidoreductase beta subunit